jgi:hypothetical protein
LPAIQKTYLANWYLFGTCNRCEKWFIEAIFVHFILKSNWMRNWIVKCQINSMICKDCMAMEWNCIFSNFIQIKTKHVLNFNLHEKLRSILPWREDIRLVKVVFFIFNMIIFVWYCSQNLKSSLTRLNIIRVALTRSNVHNMLQIIIPGVPLLQNLPKMTCALFILFGCTHHFWSRLHLSMLHLNKL